MRGLARVLAALIVTGASWSVAAQNCAGSRDIRIINGRIHTMDARDTIVSTIIIRRGLFASPQGPRDPCMKVIDVHGRTVVPGLIDNHNHLVLLGERPGHDTRLESATRIADVQATLRARSRALNRGAWITSMGGWIPGQFVEKRLPTLGELDQAAPDHPTLLYVGFTGPAVTNTLGRAYLAAHGVAVAETGVIAAGAPSLAVQFIAAHGWSFQQHSLSLAEDQLTATTFEAVNAVTPIANLRWSVAHVPQIDLPTVNRFKALGAGIAVHPYKYLSDSTDVNAGPPVRMILDSGVHVGAGSDAAQISTLDPWNMIYYMVTGINAGGHLVNAGQTVTREQALRLYTASNGWLFREEDRLGSIEPGKLGDLVVLNEDYFDSRQVPDSAIRKLRSVLTIVDGKVIYSAPGATK